MISLVVLLAHFLRRRSKSILLDREGRQVDACGVRQFIGGLRIHFKVVARDDALCPMAGFPLLRHHMAQGLVNLT